MSIIYFLTFLDGIIFFFAKGFKLVSSLGILPYVLWQVRHLVSTILELLNDASASALIL